MNWQNRKNKESARRYALECLGYHPQHSLFMPGEQCKCVELARTMGVLNKSSEVILVERDRRYDQSIIKQTNWLRPNLHRGELHELVLTKPLNYAFFDFLGSIDVNVANWMATNLSENWAGHTMCITHSFGWRYNKLLYYVQDLLHGPLKHKNRELKETLGYAEPNILVPLVLLKCIFNQFEFEIRWPFKYQDSVRSMLLFRFENFQKSASGNGWPCLADILPQPTHRGVVMKDRSKAAKKAWETRAANALAKKRSNAAKKAWATRRAV